jgi:hypothetical protein
MKYGGIGILILILSIPGCDLLNGDDEFTEGPPSLLRNGSFELWGDSLPTYWSTIPSHPAQCEPVTDTPPGGGSRSVYVGGSFTIPRRQIFQSVVVADSAREVRLAFWAEGPYGPVYFRVKRPTSIYM